MYNPLHFFVYFHFIFIKRRTLRDSHLFNLLLYQLASDLELLVDRTRRRKPDPLGAVPDQATSGGGGDNGSPQAAGADTGYLRNKALNKPVRLNVGGKVFPTTWRTMAAVPGTRLARMADSKTLDDALVFCDGYNAARNEFLFNRACKNFADIAEFHLTGRLHIRQAVK